MSESILKCKVNMSFVDKLLTIIDDWREVIIPRHIKFVDAYFKYNKNLSLAGSEFYFTEEDMLFIFWRVQQTLKEEYNKRVKDGRINKKVYIYKVTSIYKEKSIVKCYQDTDLKNSLSRFK